MESKSKHGRESEHVISELRQMYPFISHRFAANSPYVKQRCKTHGKSRAFSREDSSTWDFKHQLLRYAVIG